MNIYQKAANALKEAVKASLDQDVDPNIQSEIWRHYQGMKSIAEKIPEEQIEYKFSINDEGSISITTGLEFHNPDYNIQAAQPVDFNAYGLDTITFS